MNWSLLSVIYCSSLFTAKGLNLYQVLAPNSFSYVDGYISAINRNVHSLVYERVCWSLFRLTRLLRFKKKKHKNWTHLKLGINHITVFHETCFAVEVHVWKFFLAMFVLYIWINISFGRKKIPQPFHFICFYYLFYRVWHSLNGMMDLWRMCMSIQRCFLIIRFVDAFVTLPLVFFSDIFVMPNFPLSLERTDTTFRLLQKIADFICLW